MLLDILLSISTVLEKFMTNCILSIIRIYIYKWWKSPSNIYNEIHCKMVQNFTLLLAMKSLLMNSNIAPKIISFEIHE